jgi:hypothetical protein
MKYFKFASIGTYVGDIKKGQQINLLHQGTATFVRWVSSDWKGESSSHRERLAEVVYNSETHFVILPLKILFGGYCYVSPTGDITGDGHDLRPDLIDYGHTKIDSIDKVREYMALPFTGIPKDTVIT